MYFQSPLFFLCVFVFHSYVRRISEALVSHCPLLSGQHSYAMPLLSHGGSKYCSVVGCCSVAADWTTGNAFCKAHLHIYQTLLAFASWSAQVRLRWAVRRLLGQEHGANGAEVPFIFVRSWGRPTSLLKWTCLLLQQARLPFWVVLCPEDPSFGVYLDNSIDSGLIDMLLPGVKGADRVVAHIEALMPQGAHYMVCDDNIAEVGFSRGVLRGAAAFTQQAWRALFVHAWARLQESGLQSWAISGTPNALFHMRHNGSWDDGRWKRRQHILFAPEYGCKGFHGYMFGLRCKSARYKVGAATCVVSGGPLDDVDRGVRLKKQKGCRRHNSAVRRDSTPSSRVQCANGEDPAPAGSHH